MGVDAHKGSQGFWTANPFSREHPVFYKSPDEVAGPIREHFLSPASPRNLDSIETHKVREIL
jgi:hypothetical protein